MLPLDTIEELLKWEIPEDKYEKCTIDFSEQKLQKQCGLPITETEQLQRNKVLLCHDMKGGYLDDASIQGNDNIYAYRFYNWHLVDIFVYFSHHFITIPPTGWTYQAHKNGAQCLGTLIIESGKYLDNFMKLFNSDNLKEAVHMLNEIRIFYNFDGWLINLECSIEIEDKSYIVQNICSFLKNLSSLGNEVIWYDALTESGHLAWQNCFNDKNRIFQKHCGKIFTNYCWNEHSLNTSLISSGGCGHSIFIGVDCFGRGCPGDGGLNCKYALKMIDEASHKNDLQPKSKLSVALFGRGWCHETIPDTLKEKELDLNTWRFFNNMDPYLYSYLNDDKVYRQLPDIFIKDGTSFRTTFDIGQGHSKFKNGVIVKGGAYNNMMDQEIIPSGSVYPNDQRIDIKFMPCRDFAYCGYSCFKMVVDIVKECNNIEFPILVELFRMGCYIFGEIGASLHLVLGQVKESFNMNIWNELSIQISFSVENVMNIAKYKLGDLLEPDIRVVESIIKWSHFKIDNLREHFPDDVEVVIRKVEFILNDRHILKNLGKSSVYFGQFNIVPMK